MLKHILFCRIAVCSMLLATADTTASQHQLDLHQVVEAAAQRYALPTAVVATIIHIESRGKVCAISHAGAKGLMQFMDATAKGRGLADPYQPYEAVFHGAAYMAELLARTNGDYLRMAAMYNAGSKGRHLTYQALPKETQGYLVKFNRILSTPALNWKTLLPQHVILANRDYCQIGRTAA